MSNRQISSLQLRIRQLKPLNLKFSCRARLPRRAASTGLQHGTMPGEYAQPSNFNRREAACLLPAGNSLEFVLFWANPQDITYSHWILGLFISACCRKEQSPFPTVRADRLYEFPQPCTSSQAYTGGASGKPRPTKRTGIFPFVRSHSKGGSFWRSENPGDSHASDVGHWLRMTLLLVLSRQCALLLRMTVLLELPGNPCYWEPRRRFFSASRRT